MLDCCGFSKRICYFLQVWQSNIEIYKEGNRLCSKFLALKNIRTLILQFKAAEFVKHLRDLCECISNRIG